MAILLAVIMAITIIPSAGFKTAAATTANSITVGAVNTGKLTMAVKTSYKLEAKAKTGKLTYKSSKAGVAKVTKKGVIKAVKPGKATITIKGKNVSKKIKVTVVKKNKYKKVKKIQLKSPPKKMFASDSKKLSISFKPANASNKNLKFKSSRKSVATVSEKGIIKAIKPGTTKITVTSCANKKAKKSFTLTVVADTRFIVTFDSLGGSAVAAQKVERGKKATKPVDPTLSGAKFAGWYLDGEEIPFDFSQPITENITLFARWDVNLKEITKDGDVDSGDLALLEAAGKAEVLGDSDSTSPRAIIGTITDKKVSGKATAAAVLKSLESVFNKAIDQDGNLVETDFEVKENEITAETIDTPSDGNGKDAGKEVFYKYLPKTREGYPVEGADIVLCTDAGGNVTALHSTYDAAFRTIDCEISPNITEAYASRRATGYIRQKQDDDGNYLLPQTYSVPLNTDLELVMYAGDNFIDQSANTVGTVGSDETIMPFYAYKVHVYSDQSQDPLNSESDLGDAIEGDGATVNPSVSVGTVPKISWYVYIDVKTGEVRLAVDNCPDDWEQKKYSRRCLNGSSHEITMGYDWNNGDPIYLYHDKGRDISISQVRSYLGTDAQGNESYGKADYLKNAMLTSNPDNCRRANTLLYHASIVKDYYKNVLGRDSYDDKGSTLHIGYYADYLESSTSANAFWDEDYKRIYITFSDKQKEYARALDALGHEFTHGVVQHRVGGGKGLEYKGESGALNEAYADIIGDIIEGKLVVGDDSTWLHGEDRAKDGSSIPNRNFANPTSIGECKDHYSNLYTGDSDNGGVHRNSTIFSHAFYLMANDSRIRGEISLNRWAQLFYRSISRLSYTSKLIDGRYAVLAEAKSMAFSKQQQLAISDAFDAVGLEDPKKITFTLTWGNSPSDLDLHLVGPYNSTYYHVYYNNKIASKTQSFIFLQRRTLLASLDQDARTANGTEVIKIHTREDGVYYCFVKYPAGYDDPNSTTLAHSNAQVSVKYSTYNPTIYHINTDSKGTCWVALELRISNGAVRFCGPVSNLAPDGSGNVYRYGTSSLIDTIYSQYQ